MNAKDWENNFGNQFLITLTNDERQYLGLSPLSKDCDSLTYYSKTNLWYTKVTAFFESNTIKKVISESKHVMSDGTTNHEHYTEYDTNLETKDRKYLIPLTARGKAKPLSASNINAVTPFGCSFSIIYEAGEDTLIRLSNPRANKEFPIGEWNTIAKIKTDADFHIFMNTYISTCQNDYFSKLHKFTSAKKMTVKYKTGDIFRMELDRTHYCYGIITGTVKKLKAMNELPEKHSLRQLMMVPIMVRPYQLITDNPNLKVNELKNVPLGRLQIVGDNDIIWGTHTIVDHKSISADDLEFNFVCTKIISHSQHNTLFTQDMLIHDGIIPKQEYTLYIEWGFAQTSLSYNQLSTKLKGFLDSYSSPHGGIWISIDPHFAVPDEKHRQYHSYRNNLLNQENRDILNEIFTCLGLEPNTTFDQFAKRFGGLTLEEIAARIE